MDALNQPVTRRELADALAFILDDFTGALRMRNASEEEILEFLATRLVQYRHADAGAALLVRQVGHVIRKRLSEEDLPPET